MSAEVLGIGCAVPPYQADAENLGAFLMSVAQAQPDATPRFLRMLARLLSRSGVERRASVLPDFNRNPESFEFFPKNWLMEPFPSTQARMAVYRREAPILAVAAAEKVLAETGIPKAAVRHLVVTTCTGFYAPGLDWALATSLGLEAERYQLGFMGCYAGLSGLKLAERLCAADPDAVVLQVSVELCTLHFQKRPNLELWLGHLLFADGAAAVLYGGASWAKQSRAQIIRTASGIGGPADQMTWGIGDHGFEMYLGRGVASAVGALAPDFAQKLLSRPAEAVDRAIHPGGPAIVAAFVDALHLPEDAAAPALAVLRDHGNLSSATLFFVLEQVLAAGDKDIAAVAFGPGLTLEGALLARR